ncbi:hypothetical protein [Neobacillus bataviensis]|uniref:hypothetical protein n=1 Tax=Neobacillus bataviensis TaxID=220685 RepID=UPI001CBE4974|nr:hypothetical protein [Neobacillus bataviensis]
MTESHGNEISVEDIKAWIHGIGLKEAFMLYQLHKLLENKSKMIKGEKWVNITYDELHEELCIWSKSTIKRLIHGLEDHGYIVSANWNESKLNKSKWYTINYQKLKKLDPITFQKMMPGRGSGDKNTAVNLAETWCKHFKLNEA